jgi:pterin-4a-carbinolamine dehydratase
LQQVPAQKLEEWGLKYKETSLTETLNTRNFSYSIKKINETQIPSVMADWVKANLTTGDWGHIISNNIHIN